MQPTARLSVGLVLLVLSASWQGPVTAADEVPLTPLAQRVEQIRGLFTASPKGFEAAFHPQFLAAVPSAQMVAILEQYFKDAGAVVRADLVSSTDPFFGEYRFVTERGSWFPAKVGVEATTPHRITTFWVGLVQAGYKTPAEVVTALAALPGRTAFGYWKLGGEKPEPLFVHEPERALAIGSTFKLFILGALVEAMQKGDLAWDRVVPLEERSKSWPSGQLQEWPDGSPITLHTLASAMISTSDNTATDHLLSLVGRERVEAAQRTMGHAQPALNVPFLSTREMFRIKEQGKAAERVSAYVKLDPAARRAWLEREIAPLGGEDFGGLDLLAPTAIDTVEWFASPSDLCRAMDWLRVASASGKGAAARGILGINPGMPFSKKDWRYVGFKGGSEPGVLNMTWLLERKDGAWFVLSTGWNDTSASLDEKQLFSLVLSFVDLVGAAP